MPTMTSMSDSSAVQKKVVRDSHVHRRRNRFVSIRDVRAYD
jgi:hypothetical protein